MSENSLIFHISNYSDIIYDLLTFLLFCCNDYNECVEQRRKLKARYTGELNHPGAGEVWCNLWAGS